MRVTWNRLLLIFFAVVVSVFFVQSSYLSPPGSRSLQKPPSVFIFGLGGSGTRAVSALFHSWGCANVSEENRQHDNTYFFQELDIFIHEILAHTHSADYEYSEYQQWFNSSMLELFNSRFSVAAGQVKKALALHPRCTTVKDPRLLYLLPALHHFLPDAKFVHVVRDGRDMAFSPNKGQLAHLGKYIMSPHENGSSINAQQVRFWFLINMQAQHYLRRNVKKGNYMMINVESLVSERKESDYRKLWNMTFNEFPKANVILSKNDVFDDPIGLDNWINMTERYGKWNYLTGENKVILSTIEDLYHTELAEFNYVVKRHK